MWMVSLTSNDRMTDVWPNWSSRQPFQSILPDETLKQGRNASKMHYSPVIMRKISELRRESKLLPPHFLSSIARIYITRISSKQAYFLQYSSTIYSTPHPTTVTRTSCDQNPSLPCSSSWRFSPQWPWHAIFNKTKTKIWTLTRNNSACETSAPCCLKNARLFINLRISPMEISVFPTVIWERNTKTELGDAVHLSHDLRQSTNPLGMSASDD